jgi:UDP-N-acetylglucosamine--N-acetylmuramyl-(pentapeptide) pyrophosphoryl-undecaprenol N-acetylglucosamine transferase
VATTFEATAAGLPAGPRVERTGNPIRPAIVAVGERRDRLAAEGRDAFDLAPDRRTVLVLGGSQGARRLDQAVAAALPLLRDRGDLQLLVSTGQDHLAIVASAIDPEAELLVHAEAFIERMDAALALADVALARAGAGQCAELTACGVPAVLVPYPHATERHQDANARELVAAGAARLLPDEDLSPERVASSILQVVDDPELRGRMEAAGRTWARPDAARRIAELIEEQAT